MKILIVITKSEIGGAQIFSLNLAKQLKALGEEVVVAGGEGEFLPQELAKENIDFYRFKQLKRGFSLVNNFRFLKELKDYVRANNFSVVHLNSTNALLGVFPLSCLKKKGLKVKTVFSVHGLSLIDGGHRALGIIKFCYLLFFKLAFKKLDEIVFVSRKNFEFAKASSLLNSGIFKKASLIYNGLDLPTDYFLEKEIAREKLKLSFPEATFIYGSIGRLAYPKNYEFLISSYKDLREKIPQAKLIIIGEGPERGKYQDMIKAYGLSEDIILLGEIKDASMYLKAFDLFVLPSVFEGLSLSLIEAKLAKVPSLASLVGGNEEIVSASHCFKLNDAEDFIAKAVKVSQGANLELQADSEPGEEESFSAKEMAEKYLKLYLRQ